MTADARPVQPHDQPQDAAEALPVESTDALTRILEDVSADDNDHSALILVQVDGALRVTSRQDPGGMPVIVNREALGYRLSYGVETARYATPEYAASAIRSALFPSMDHATGLPVLGAWL